MPKFSNRRTGVTFRIDLADLEEIRVPDYLIINCDITVTGEKATLVNRKQLGEELLRRARRAEDISKR